MASVGLWESGKQVASRMQRKNRPSNQDPESSKHETWGKSAGAELARERFERRVVRKVGPYRKLAYHPTYTLALKVVRSRDIGFRWPDSPKQEEDGRLL